MTKRGARATRPPQPGQWTIRYADNETGKGWDDLSSQMPSSIATLFDKLTADPTHADNRNRQGPLRGTLGHAQIQGQSLPQWQYELASGGRIWYAIDQTKKTVWITKATARHPNETK